MRPVLQDIILCTLSVLETITFQQDGVPVPPATFHVPVVMHEQILATHWLPQDAPIYQISASQPAAQLKKFLHKVNCTNFLPKVDRVKS